MRVLVMLPTYNEIENIEDVLERARAALPDADVLVIDDGSPDGTADQAEKLGEELGGIEVLRRAAKSGLGSAYRAGFRVGLARGYDVMIEMDADLSHDPAVLPDAGRRGRAGRRPRHRLALRARRLDPRLEAGSAAPSRVAAGSTRARCSGSRCRTPPPGSVPTTADSLSRHRPRPRPGRRVRLPGRDDLPHRAQRRPHRRGADRVPRPHARPVEDVERASWWRRSCWSRGGASGTGCAGSAPRRRAVLAGARH